MASMPGTGYFPIDLLRAAGKLRGQQVQWQRKLTRIGRTITQQFQRVRGNLKQVCK